MFGFLIHSRILSRKVMNRNIFGKNSECQIRLSRPLERCFSFTRWSEINRAHRINCNLPFIIIVLYSIINGSLPLLPVQSPLSSVRWLTIKNNHTPDVGWDELGKCFEADYNFIAPHQSSGGCNKYQQLKHSFSRLLREKLFYWKFRSNQHHLINL